ncbi:unnamed protein product, partial [Hymenolepis diminuta]
TSICHSKRPYRFPPFHNSLISPNKYICTHTLVRPYPNESHKTIPAFSLKKVHRSFTGSYASC